VKKILTSLIAIQIVLASCLWAFTISVVDHKWSGAATSTTTAGLNCPGANAMLGVAVDFSVSAASGAMSDDSGINMYTATTNSNDGGSNNAAVWYSAGATLDSSVAVTKTGLFPAIFMACASGVKTSSPLDVQSQLFGNFPFGAGSVTTSEDGELCIAGLANSALGVTYSIDSGYTITDQSPLVGGSNEGGAMAYKIITTAGATNPQWDLSGGGNGTATIACFKMQASTGAVPRHHGGFF